MGYELLDAGGDAAVRATASTLEGVFEEAALGLYALLGGGAGHEGNKVVEIKVESHGIEGLMVGLLNELIYRFEVEGLVGQSVKVVRLSVDPPELSVVIAGCEACPSSTIGLAVKAATYHGIKVERAEAGWLAEVMFDI